MIKFDDKKILYWTVLALLAYMPFHLFLSRWLSLYTGGLGQWDAAKDIVTSGALVISLRLAWREKLFKNRVVLSIFILAALYGILHVAFLLFDRKDQNIRSLVIASLYNGRIFAYVFVAMIVGMTQKIDWLKVFKIVIIASTITCLFALVQYVAPKDLMTHFGYNLERGVKTFFFIDDKLDFPRVMSTIRDPNSYGAYLIVPITMLWLLALAKGRELKWRAYGLLAIHFLALLLTFSRGAWIGAIISLILATLLAYKDRVLSTLKKYVYVPIILLIIGSGVAYGLRDTYVFQNVFLHSDQSTVLADPNELRIQLQRQAVNYIIQQPLGHGPGTAGLVSIGNPNGGLLTENYYLQIAYEVGLPGLLIFLVFSGLIVSRVYFSLYLGRIPIMLLSTFGGYIFISFLIHLWSNEAVAAQWWLLAGACIGLSNISRPDKMQKAQQPAIIAQRKQTKREV